MEKQGKRAEGFTIDKISDKIFSSMYDKSYKGDCTTRREDLRVLKLRHWDFEGERQQGMMVCHKDIAQDLADIFVELYELRYPIQKVVPIDIYEADDEASMADNNSSCFNFRMIEGTKRLSKHSLGRAVDINPRYNPYVKSVNGQLCCWPQNALAYMDRTIDSPYLIRHGDVCWQAFINRGFSWGGDWETRKDYQHFEK